MSIHSRITIMRWSYQVSDAFSKHVGIRGAINSWQDYEHDAAVDFVISHAEDIEDVGYKGIVQKIRGVVGDNPVYSAQIIRSFTASCGAYTCCCVLVTLDIDVIDPGMAPATGT
jgi:agmatinase